MSLSNRPTPRVARMSTWAGVASVMSVVGVVGVLRVVSECGECGRRGPTLAGRGSPLSWSRECSERPSPPCRQSTWSESGAEHRRVDERGNGQILEEGVDGTPHHGALGAAAQALVTEAVECVDLLVRVRVRVRVRGRGRGRGRVRVRVRVSVECVDLLVLVVAAEQVDLRGVADLEREEQH
eukprot:scaffold76620_cov51-Phaeocystis_antarctica.AAC.1